MSPGEKRTRAAGRTDLDQERIVPTTATAASTAPTFSWRARRTDGRVETGRATASSREALIGRLTRDPAYESVISVCDLAAVAAVSPKASPKLTNLVATIHQLALCLEVGMPALDAIDQVLSKGGVQDRVLSYGLEQVRGEMRDDGAKMSAAMEKHPYIFPPVLIETLKAGEQSATIPEAMRQAAADLEATEDQRRRVKKAMNYPLVVLVVFSLIFTFLMLFVVPKFGDLFSSLSGGTAKLPLLTRVVMGFSDQMKWIAPVVAVIVVVGLVWYRRHSRDEKVRDVVDPLLIKLPRVGNMFRFMALSRFCKTMASLSENGVHPIQALTITSSAVNSRPMEKAIIAARDGKSRGETMVESLSKEPLFPPMLLSFIDVAENTGKMAPSLRASARDFDREIDEMITNMESLLQPIFMLLIAGMILIVGLAVYLPTFSLGDVISPY